MFQLTFIVQIKSMLLPLQHSAKFKFTTIKQDWHQYYTAVVSLQTITVYMLN